MKEIEVDLIMTLDIEEVLKVEVVKITMIILATLYKTHIMGMIHDLIIIIIMEEEEEEEEGIIMILDIEEAHMAEVDTLVEDSHNNININIINHNKSERNKCYNYLSDLNLIQKSRVFLSISIYYFGLSSVVQITGASVSMMTLEETKALEVLILDPNEVSQFSMVK
jgi:hypothetical protein